VVNRFVILLLRLTPTLFAESDRALRVRGCSIDAENERASRDCATHALTAAGSRIQLTISGVDFECSNSRSVNVRLGDAVCANVRAVAASELVCELPESDGAESAVSVCCGNVCRESLSALVSFAAPRVNRVSGCPLDSSACDNSSDARSLLTLHGANFGRTASRVLLGTEFCAPRAEQWSHTRVVADCAAALSAALTTTRNGARQVALVRADGSFSNVVAVSLASSAPIEQSTSVCAWCAVACSSILCDTDRDSGG
jgi:hypothetical protein